jgi:hypothetical protein
MNGCTVYKRQPLPDTESTGSILQLTLAPSKRSFRDE